MADDKSRGQATDNKDKKSVSVTVSVPALGAGSKMKDYRR
jgi:hypothetical protein